MRKHYEVFKRCTLFHGFTNPELETVLAALDARMCHYKKLRLVRPCGVQVTEIGIVLSGAVYTEKTDIYGNRHILAEICAGSTFGESLSLIDSSNSPIAIVAEFESEIAFLSSQKLVDMMKGESVYRKRLTENFIRLLAEKNMMLQIKNDILSRKTIREKLLLYFEYESKTANSNTFRIHFSREQLADFLCLNTSALSRELGKMRDEGILVYKKNKFTLR